MSEKCRKMAKVSRAEEAGRRAGENVNEQANLFYNEKTKANFIKGVKKILGKDLLCQTCFKKYNCYVYGDGRVCCCGYGKQEEVI